MGNLGSLRSYTGELDFTGGDVEKKECSSKRVETMTTTSNSLNKSTKKVSVVNKEDQLTRGLDSGNGKGRPGKEINQGQRTFP